MQADYEVIWNGAMWREARLRQHVPSIEPELPRETRAKALLCEEGIMTLLRGGFTTRRGLIDLLPGHSVSGVGAALQRLKRRGLITSKRAYLTKRQKIGALWGLASMELKWSIPTEKECRGACRRTLPLSDYGVKSNSPDGRARICKACITEYNRQYRRNRPRPGRVAVRRVKISEWPSTS